MRRAGDRRIAAGPGRRPARARLHPVQRPMPRGWVGGRAGGRFVPRGTVRRTVVRGVASVAPEFAGRASVWPLGVPRGTPTHRSGDGGVHAERFQPARRRFVTGKHAGGSLTRAVALGSCGAADRTARGQADNERTVFRARNRERRVTCAGGANHAAITRRPGSFGHACSNRAESACGGREGHARQARPRHRRAHGVRDGRARGVRDGPGRGRPSAILGCIRSHRNLRVRRVPRGTPVRRRGTGRGWSPPVPRGTHVACRRQVARLADTGVPRGTGPVRRPRRPRGSDGSTWNWSRLPWTSRNKERRAAGSIRTGRV